MQWATDLIGYDALTSYGSPSYWAQVLFAGNVGTEVVDSTLANTGARIYTSVTRDEKRRKLFVKVVNATSEAQPLAITLEGAGKVWPQGRLMSISGRTPNATNSIAHPRAIVPVENHIPVPGSKFQQSFAPYSINVLELGY
jgi:alpha-N-arabinofuranosidase